MSCNCTLAQRTVGDGCEICNPAKALDYAKETIDDLQARVAELEALVQRTLWHADNALLVLPPEMVREFRDAMEGKG